MAALALGEVTAELDGGPLALGSAEAEDVEGACVVPEDLQPIEDAASARAVART